MPEFLQASIQVLLGIGLLFGGGELFVQGSVAMAVIFGIPQLVIGLTVVSLGTSAPELFVSLSSVLQGADTLAVSNVVGSNIFNVMVVLGSSALVLPLRVESRLVRRDVPLMIAISAAVWGMASAGRVTWQAGLALLLGHSCEAKSQIGQCSPKLRFGHITPARWPRCCNGRRPP